MPLDASGYAGQLERFLMPCWELRACCSPLTCAVRRAGRTSALLPSMPALWENIATGVWIRDLSDLMQLTGLVCSNVCSGFLTLLSNQCPAGNRSLCRLAHHGRAASSDAASSCRAPCERASTSCVALP